MARPLRPEHYGAIWHAYNRGVNRADIFFCDDDRLLFMALLAEAVRRSHWILHQVTLMTNLSTWLSRRRSPLCRAA